MIDQDGREIRTPGCVRSSRVFGSILGIGANPFGNLTREQRLARLDAMAKLLDVAFILPGTNIRYGIDGLIGLIPVIGDIITTAISLWLVREARALGAPWHITARMLGQCRARRRGRHGAARGRCFRRHVPRQCAQCADAQALDGQAAARVISDMRKKTAPGSWAEGRVADECESLRRVGVGRRWPAGARGRRGSGKASLS